MPTANDVFRDYSTEGMPSSGEHRPEKSQIRALLNGYVAAIADAEATAIRPRPKIAVVMDSWGAGLADALQASFDQRYDRASPYLQDDSIPGTTLAPFAPIVDPSISNRVIETLSSGAAEVYIGTGLNDIASSIAWEQIRDAIVSIVYRCNTARCRYKILAPPPFKGSPLEGLNAAAIATATALRSWLLATYPADTIIDSYVMLAADGGASPYDAPIRAEWADPSKYHLTATGYEAFAAMIVDGWSGGPGKSIPTPPPVVMSVTTSVEVDQTLTRKAVPTFAGAILGRDYGSVATLTLMAADPLNPKKAIYQAQPRTPAAGNFVDTETDGKYIIARYADPGYYKTLLRLTNDPVSGDLNEMTGGIWAIRDGEVARFSTAAYGGGIGNSLVVYANAGGMALGAYEQGGAEAGKLTIQSSKLVLSGADGYPSTSRICLKSDELAYLWYDSVGIKTSGVSYLGPVTSGAMTIGTSGAGVGQIYSTVSTISTSDARAKYDIEEIAPSIARAMLRSLRSIQYRFREADPVTVTVQATDDAGSPLFDEVEEEITDEVETDVDEVQVRDHDGVKVAHIVRIRKTITQTRRIDVPLLREGVQVVERLPAFGMPGEEGYLPARDVPLSVSVSATKTVRRPRMIERIETRPGRRLHLGYAAKEVEAAWIASGIPDPWIYAMLALADPGDPDSLGALRIDHLLPLLWAATRDIDGDVAYLQDQVDALRRRLEEMDKGGLQTGPTPK